MLISYQCAVPRELIYLVHAAPIRHPQAYNIFPIVFTSVISVALLILFGLLLYFHCHLCHHHCYIIITNKTFEHVPFRVLLN